MILYNVDLLICKIKHIIEVISGFCCKVDEDCSLLGYYAASSGNLLPMFRENFLVPSSGVKNPKPLKIGPIGCAVTPVRNNHYLLLNTPEKCSSQPFLLPVNT